MIRCQKLLDLLLPLPPGSFTGSLGGRKFEHGSFPWKVRQGKQAEKLQMEIEEMELDRKKDEEDPSERFFEG